MKIILTILFVSISAILTAQTGVGINTPNPEASSALDISSTSKGLLIPRMTEVQRIAINPSVTANGLLVYQIDGVAGFYYYDGTQWKRIEGIQGPIGLTGPQGEQGIQGEVGPQGPIGLTGPQGEVGPQGPIGLTGPQGEQGIQGDVGPQGSIGLTGPQGEQGIQGEVGPQGPIGLTGPQGEQGIQGEVGPQGPIGLTGPQGEQGVQGEVGPQGSIGLTGPQGEQGVQGEVGPQGSIGLTGPQGEQGVQGEVGPQGSIGLTGPQGEQGIQGEVGPQGPIGLTGQNGLSAYDVYAANNTDPDLSQIDWLASLKGDAGADVIISLTTTTVDYSVLTTDTYIVFEGDTNGVITLPTAVGISGKEYTIKNMTLFGVTIVTTGNEQIWQDVNNKTLTVNLGIEAQNNWIKVVSDGTKWISFRALY